MPTAAAIRSFPRRRWRGVQGGAERALTGEDAHQHAVRVDRGRQLAVGGVEAVEGVPRVDVRVQDQQVPGHDLGHLGEAVHPGQVVLGDDADRAAALDDDARAVRPLGQQRQGVGHGRDRGQHDRRVQDQMTALDPGHDVGDDIERDVLRNDDQATAAGHGLRHPAAGDRRHVGDHERDGGPGPVVRAQVHGLAGADGGASGHHEHIVVGQVVGHRRTLFERAVLRIQESHMARIRALTRVI